MIDDRTATGSAVPTPRPADDDRELPGAGRSAVIVGSGIVGASIAWRLTRSGWRVTLVEEYAPAHARAASGGPSRLVRFAEGDDEETAASCVRAGELWDRVGDELGAPLLVRSGYLMMGSEAQGGFHRATVASHERLGVDYEELDPASAAALFPSLRTDDLAHLLFEPEAGFVLARLAVQRLVADAQRRGMRLLGARAARAGDAVDGEGELVEADIAIWAVGGWTPRLFPELISGRAERHDLVQFAADHRWRTPGVPAWTDLDAVFDGMGDVDGGGVRLGGYFHEPADLDAPTWLATEHQRSVARAVLEHRFPSLVGAPLTGALACHSTEITAVHADPLAIVGGARIWRVPGHERTWVVGDGSASLFKHGPDIGWQVEGLVADAG